MSIILRIKGKKKRNQIKCSIKENLKKNKIRQENLIYMCRWKNRNKRKELFFI